MNYTPLLLSIHFILNGKTEMCAFEFSEAHRPNIFHYIHRVYKHAQTFFDEITMNGNDGHFKIDVKTLRQCSPPFFCHIFLILNITSRYSFLFLVIAFKIATNSRNGTNAHMHRLHLKRITTTTTENHSNSDAIFLTSKSDVISGNSSQMYIQPERMEKVCRKIGYISFDLKRI